MVGSSCAAEPTATEPVARGRQVYRELDCGSCHEATVWNGFRAIGPPLEHVGTVAAERAAGQTAEEYLRRSVLEPGAFVVPGYPDSMPRGLADRLSPDDLDALVAYLRSLR